MKNQRKKKSLSRRRPLRKEKSTIETSQTTKLKAPFNLKEQTHEEPVQPVKRVSKGADEEME
jgi:hypothetical protein